MRAKGLQVEQLGDIVESLTTKRDRSKRHLYPVMTERELVIAILESLPNEGVDIRLKYILSRISPLSCS